MELKVNYVLLFLRLVINRLLIWLICSSSVKTSELKDGITVRCSIITDFFYTKYNPNSIIFQFLNIIYIHETFYFVKTSRL